MKRFWVLALLLAFTAGATAQAPVTMQGPPQPSQAPAAGANCDEGEAPSAWWKLVPPVQPMPRLGYSPVLPTGAGCYSLVDRVKGECGEKPPKYPYPRFGIIPFSFFDVDWKYLDDPKNTEWDHFDWMKRCRFCEDEVMFTSGGEFRYRSNHEVNSRLLNVGPPGLRGITNDYDLTRVRVYGDLYVTKWLRVYAEFIAADIYNADLPPGPSDRNWGDLLNAFVDARALEVNGSPVWLRVGRQELLYGSQRLISPLDWVNTRRTFQGVKAFWQGENLSLDAFCVQPVIPNNRRFDSVDNNIVFSGLWATYKFDKGRYLDAYVLNLDRAGAADPGLFGRLGPSNVTTYGSRYFGQYDSGLLIDLEGMLQSGTFSNRDQFAGAATAGAGYHWKDAPGKPTFWVYYDFASGDRDPGSGTRGTFEQLFPFGHYYFGFIDVVGRKNIHDINAAVTFYPTEWVTVQGQAHNFHLASSRDALYSASGALIRQDRTGRAGNYVGQEFDLLLNFHLTRHQDVFLSYSYLFAGAFIRQTATTAAGRRDPQALYLQYSYRW